MFGSKIFLIATGVPFSSPLYIMEKPPWPIFSPKSKSYSVISLTPGTGGRRPALSETSLLHLVKAWKLALWISFFKLSISSASFFWCFLSFFNYSSSYLTWAFVWLAVAGLSMGCDPPPKFIQFLSCSLLFMYAPRVYPVMSCLGLYPWDDMLGGIVFENPELLYISAVGLRPDALVLYAPVPAASENYRFIVPWFEPLIWLWFPIDIYCWGCLII